MALKNIDLAKLTTTQGIKIKGDANYAHSGWCVRGVGDVNGNGYDDVIISAMDASPLGRTKAGVSYLIFGSKAPSDINLGNLTASQGIKIQGAAAYDASGYSVSGVGDVDGDSFADFIIGAYHASPLGRGSAGESYLIFGGNSLVDIDLNSLTIPQGIKIQGANAGDNSGVSISGAGDVDGDGFADVIIGAYRANPLGRGGAGESYLIFGGNFTANIDLGQLTLPHGIKIQGANVNDNSGWSVSGAGDVDGDGFADVIIGAHYASPLERSAAGESYLILGGNFTANIDLRQLTLLQGIKIQGAAAEDWSGYSVSDAGDVNNDGYADFLIGAYEASPLGRHDAGESYLIFGGSSFANIDLNSITMPQGIKIKGADALDNSGVSVSRAGDVNKDGYGDFLIGASGAPAGTSKGISYLFFGKSSGFTDIDLKKFTEEQGIKIQGASSTDSSGHSVSSTRDFNNDGYDDVTIGAFGATSSELYEAGESYLIFGGGDIPPSPPDNRSSSWTLPVIIGSSVAAVALIGFGLYKYCHHKAVDDAGYNNIN